MPPQYLQTQVSTNIYNLIPAWRYWRGEITPRQLEQEVGKTVAAQVLVASIPPDLRWDPRRGRVVRAPAWVRRVH